MSHLPIILITAGDPNGIGPEVALKALSIDSGDACVKILVCEAGMAEESAAMCSIVYNWPVGNSFEEALSAAQNHPRKTAIYSCAAKADFKITPGHLSTEAGRAAVGWLEVATELAMNGMADAIVTGPMDKRLFCLEREDFGGHTEWLAKRAGIERPVMMLTGEGLRVVPLTRHIPIAEVPAAISTEEIIHTTKIIADSLRRYWKIAEPRIGILALNPHAGESGKCGREEIDIIAPAIHSLQAAKISAEGPLSPDTVFTSANLRNFDVFVCMYHDQGLIPLKMLAFDSGVNITLGLPFIRTSPDHGTAYDIAGRGIASPVSMIQAMRTAEEMSRNES